MTRKPRTPQPSVTDGFTIVELVIVVGLLIIISFIAVNSYLGTQRDTEDIRTRQVLELAAARGEEAARFNQRRFPDNLHTAIASGTQINATDGESTGPTVVSAVAANDITAVYVAKSESGRCWVLVDSLVSPNRWWELPQGTPCAATAVDTDPETLETYYQTWEAAINSEAPTETEEPAED